MCALVGIEPPLGPLHPQATLWCLTPLSHPDPQKRIIQAQVSGTAAVREVTTFPLQRGMAILLSMKHVNVVEDISVQYSKMIQPLVQGCLRATRCVEGVRKVSGNCFPEICVW